MNPPCAPPPSLRAKRLTSTQKNKPPPKPQNHGFDPPFAQPALGPGKPTRNTEQPMTPRAQCKLSPFPGWHWKALRLASGPLPPCAKVCQISKRTQFTPKTPIKPQKQP